MVYSIILTYLFDYHIVLYVLSNGRNLLEKYTK